METRNVGGMYILALTAEELQVLYLLVARNHIIPDAMAEYYNAGGFPYPGKEAMSRCMGKMHDDIRILHENELRNKS